MALGNYAAERVLSGAADTALGARRLAKWAGLMDDDPATCALAISALGVDRDRLIGLLGAPAAGVAEGHPPPWVSLAGRLRALGAGYRGDPAEYGLVTVAADLVEGARAELSRRLAAERTQADRTQAGREQGDRVGTGWPDELAGLDRILGGTWPKDELEMAVHRTMVLELNVARVRGRLRGDSPAERYASYLGQLTEPQVRREIWAEYPVLLRFCAERLGYWVDGCCEFARRLAADFGALPELLGGTPGPLTGVRFGAGDRHRGGRAVAIADFAAGPVVYKPRSLGIERAWQAVVGWFNGRQPRRTLLAAPTVLRDGYGWAGHVAGRPGADEADVGDFYWRIGALTALLHALRAIDINIENVIVAGGLPVPVDLETLLHDADAPWGGQPDPAEELLRQGVTRIGLLPGKWTVRAGGRARSFDYGVVGLGGELVSPIPSMVTERAGTDQVRVVNRYVTFDKGYQRVSLGAEVPDPLRYCDDVIAGFGWTYRAIMTDRGHWLRSLLPGFAGSPVRFLPHPTSFYGRLLTDSLHPDFLRDALERELSLARVADHVDDVATTPAALPGSELADLRSGDIPYFEAYPESRDLSGRHGAKIGGYLAEPPLDAARARVASLDEADLATQARLIRLSFGSLHGAPDAGLPAQALDGEPLDWDEARVTAGELAARLCRSAVRGPTGIGWLGIEYVDESIWQLGAASPDLYSGRSGIGLFLSTVAAHWPNRADRLSLADRPGLADEAGRADRPSLADQPDLPEIVRTARMVAEATALHAVALAERIQRRDRTGERVRREIEHFANPGAFGEIGGTIFYLVHAGILHGRADFLVAAEALVPVLREHIRHDDAFDVVGGSAGAILVLLALQAVRPSPDTLAAARFAAERLLTVPDRAGPGWLAADGGSAPRLGMAHGAAGICYALGRLHEVAPDPVLADAIAEGLRYEREHYDSAAQNWPQPATAVSGQPLEAKPGWCYGASGIGLAMLGLLRHPASPEVADQAGRMLRDAQQAVALWVLGRDGARFGSVGQHGLCHGDLGNLEFLALAARCDAGAAEPGDERAALRAARAMRDYGRSKGWLTGALDAEATPGLMYGLAGVGYGLLRLTGIERVPSILLLEPPRLSWADGEHPPG